MSDSEEIVDAEVLEYAEAPGPGIAPVAELEDPAAEPAGAGTAELVQDTWAEETWRQIIEGVGELAHAAAAIDPDSREWKATEADLDRIVPPLTRISNRHQVIAQFAPAADPLLVAHGLVMYAARNVIDRRRIRAEVEAELAQGDRYVRTDETAPASAPASTGGGGRAVDRLVPPSARNGEDD